MEEGFLEFSSTYKKHREKGEPFICRQWEFHCDLGKCVAASGLRYYIVHGST